MLLVDSVLVYIFPFSYCDKYFPFSRAICKQIHQLVIAWLTGICQRKGHTYMSMRRMDMDVCPENCPIQGWLSCRWESASKTWRGCDHFISLLQRGYLGGSRKDRVSYFEWACMVVAARGFGEAEPARHGAPAERPFPSRVPPPNCSCQPT
jgi:hypothetical protein